MPRSKQYTIVRLVAGALEASTYENDGAAREALAHIDDESEAPGASAVPPLVFVGEPVPFAINRKPTVTLGEARGRKPRAKKDAAAPRARKPKGTVVGADLFEKPANGAAVTTTPALAETPPQAQE